MNSKLSKKNKQPTKKSAKKSALFIALNLGYKL